MKLNFQKYDPVNLHNRCMSRIPQLNDSSFLISKSGHVGLSALAILTGTLAVTRELVVGTVRLVPGQLIAIPVGMVRLIKKDWLKEAAHELSFHRVVESYDRACAQLVGVAVSIMALAAELIFYQHQAGANENYEIQVKLGNVKNDLRPALEAVRAQTLKDLQGKVEGQQRELLGLKETIRELTGKVEGQQIQINVLDGANEHLAKWLDDCKKELAGVRNDLSRRVDVERELLGIDELEMRLKEAESNKEDLNELLTAFEEMLLLLLKTLKENKVPLNDQTTNANSKGRFDKLLDLINQTNENLEILTDTVEDVKEDVTQTRKEMREIEDTLLETIGEVEDNCIESRHAKTENAIAKRPSQGLREVPLNTSIQSH